MRTTLADKINELTGLEETIERIEKELIVAKLDYSVAMKVAFGVCPGEKATVLSMIKAIHRCRRDFD